MLDDDDDNDDDEDEDEDDDNNDEGVVVVVVVESVSRESVKGMLRTWAKWEAGIPQNIWTSPGMVVAMLNPHEENWGDTGMMSGGVSILDCGSSEREESRLTEWSIIIEDEDEDEDEDNDDDATGDTNDDDEEDDEEEDEEEEEDDDDDDATGEEENESRRKDDLTRQNGIFIEGTNICGFCVVRLCRDRISK